MNAVCVMLGGPTYWINVRGKPLPFEDHPYCGPTPVAKNDLAQPREVIPAGFWEAIELWEKGGRVMDGDKCVVPLACKSCDGSGDNVRHLGGRHYEIVGRCEECAGKGFVFA